MSLIASKNDELRAQLPSIPRPHKLVLTEGVRGLGMAGINEVINEVKKFNNFTEGNDPYGEHDAFLVEVNGNKYICKIDCYDDNYEGFKVFTIMCASEY